jgi:hypothetical protein
MPEPQPAEALPTRNIADDEDIFVDAEVIRQMVFLFVSCHSLRHQRNRLLLTLLRVKLQPIVCVLTSANMLLLHLGPLPSLPQPSSSADPAIVGASLDIHACFCIFSGFQ